jgi:hypothetical protein
MPSIEKINGLIHKKRWSLLGSGNINSGNGGQN